MNRHLTATLVLVTAAFLLPSSSTAQEEPAVRLSWLVAQDLSWEVVRPGQCRHLLLETAEPSYVAVFEWTPDDDLILLQPFHPDQPLRFASAKPEAIRTGPFDAYCWHAGSDRRFGAGLGYLVAIASPEPLDLYAGLDALGVPRRWGGANFSARGVTYNADHAFDILLEALGADEESTWVLGYAIERR
jgi:hypothetical protein